MGAVSNSPPATPGTPTNIAQLREQLSSILNQHTDKLDASNSSVLNLLKTFSPLLERTEKIETSLDQFKSMVIELLAKCQDGMDREDIQNLALAMIHKAEKFIQDAEVSHESVPDIKAYVDIAKTLVDIEKANADLLKTKEDMDKTKLEMEKLKLEMEKLKAETDKTKREKDKLDVEIEEKQANIEKMKDEKRRGWTVIIVAIFAMLFTFFGGAGFARFVKGN